MALAKPKMLETSYFIQTTIFISLKDLIKSQKIMLRHLFFELLKQTMACELTNNYNVIVKQDKIDDNFKKR